MTATYTWDVFCTLDGFGSYEEPGDWGGYWGKQGPEFLAHRLAQYSTDLRLVFGAHTHRAFARMVASADTGSEIHDAWVTQMLNAPSTVVSTTLREPLEWPNAELSHGDAAEVVARLKRQSDTPLRSDGSLAMNRALLAAGLVDALQVTICPVISGSTGAAPILGGASDFDLELLTSRTFDDHILELTYRPARHRNHRSEERRVGKEPRRRWTEEHMQQIQ